MEYHTSLRIITEKEIVNGQVTSTKEHDEASTKITCSSVEELDCVVDFLTKNGYEGKEIIPEMKFIEFEGLDFWYYRGTEKKQKFSIHLQDEQDTHDDMLEILYSHFGTGE